MDSRCILQKSTAGTRLGGADPMGCRAGRTVLRDARVPVPERRGPGPATGPVPCKCRPGGGSPAELKSPRAAFKGNGVRRISLDMEKVSVLNRACACACAREIHPPKVRSARTVQGLMQIPVIAWLNVKIGDPPTHQGT